MLSGWDMTRDPSLSSPNMARVLAGQDPTIEIDLKGLKVALLGWGIGLAFLLLLLVRGVGSTPSHHTGPAQAGPRSASSSTR